MKTTSSVAAAPAGALKPRKKKNNIFKRFWQTRFLFALLVPTIVFYIIFAYMPMWGIRFAFYDYNPWAGLEGSDFVGLKHFTTFLSSPIAGRVIKNTVVISIQSLMINWPITIFFALVLNEVRFPRYKKVVQTVSYLPHFLSTVVMCGIVTSFLAPETGAINMLIKAFGGESIYFMAKSQYYRTIWHVAGLWKGVGWGTIVYLAAISAVDPTLYEAARLDGAGRWRQMWNITLPSIAPTVITMLILKMGDILDTSLEKTLLLQHAATIDVSEVIASYVYKVGIGQSNYSFSTAIGLWQMLVNLILVLITNWISNKVTDSGGIF